MEIIAGLGGPSMFNARLLDGMVVFAEVVNSGSFTRAADNSGYSTSYISKEISKLESRLGTRLLNRTTRSLSLTPEGEAYYRQCQQIIQEAEQAEAVLSGAQMEPQGTLRISCPVSFGLSRLRPVIAAFTERFPDVRLDLNLDDRKVDLVAEGVDVAIRASQQLEDSSLVSRRLLASQGVSLASPDYLARFGTPTHPTQLTSHSVITYSYLRQPHNWVYHSVAGEEVAVTVNSRVLTNSPEMELALCLAGQGITRLPRFNLGDEVQTGALVELFPDWPGQAIDIYLVYPSRQHLSAKVRSFIDFLVDALGDDGA